MSNPRHVTPPKRRASFLNTDGGTNPDDAKGTNLNTLVAQYRKNGTMPNVYVQQPLAPSDLVEPRSLHEAIEQSQAAFDRFNELPADVRTAAENDPVRFLEMFNDPTQRDLLESAGLITINTPPDTTPDKDTLDEVNEALAPASSVAPEETST